jgi:hypothetical protein
MYGWWKRAIFTSSVVALTAIVGATTIAWFRRPRERPPVERARTPVLYNEPDGSVYDLNLRMEQLAERLLAGEVRTRQLETEVGRLRTERDALEKRLRENERQLARLKKRLEERAAPRPEPTEPREGGAAPGTNAPGNTPGLPPDSSTGETPPIFPPNTTP